MQLFYAADFTAPEYMLSEEEARHAVKVLRLVEGDTLHITDGRGNLYRCEVASAHQKHCLVRVVEHFEEFEKLPYRLTMAVAPTKNIERLEWMVEKCTEIGVDEITPLLCRFSERKNLRNDRLEKIILSAAKQSLTPYLPKLNPLTDFATLMEMYKPTPNPSLKGRELDEERGMDKFIAHCYKDEKCELKDALRKGRDVLILIGPEGDFSEQEVEQAIAQGFVPVGLGRSRLRTETAGVVACHTVVLMNED